MQLQEALPESIAGEVQFAGGVKPDGNWGGNSLFNNKPFRKEMNAAIIKGLDQAAKKQLRAQLKKAYGSVPCTEEQLDEVRTDGANA